LKELVSKRQLKDIPVIDIDLADENVRTPSDSGIEELKASIERLGLIQPVVVIPNGNRFSLIVGQRRWVAFQELGRKTIPAIVVNKVEADDARLISFGENIHRRKLPYNDTIKVCDILFSRHKGGPSQRIDQIALELNIHPNTVRKYLAYKLVPSPVQAMVSEGTLSPDIAYRITTAFWPNVKRIVEVAKLSSEMTSDEKRRLVELGRKNPEVSLNELLMRVKEPSGDVEIVLHVEPSTLGSLTEAARARKMDVDALLKSVIEEWLEEESQKR
jgi:ParB family transcriptional regulator, chromosome partitioning protein